MNDALSSNLPHNGLIRPDYLE